MRRPRKPRRDSLAERLDRRVGRPTGEDITFSQGLRNITEFHAAYALHCGKDPRAWVKETLRTALEQPADAEWKVQKQVDGEDHWCLSQAGTFRFVFHRPGQTFDRTDPYLQEVVFPFVQETLEEGLKDPDAMRRRSAVRFRNGD